MTDSISIDSNRLTDVLDDMRQKELSSVLTTDIIECYMGGFHQNKKVPHQFLEMPNSVNI